MMAAGLNPMLAYSQGGAGTPSGAVGYAAQAAPMQNALQGVGSAVASLRPSEMVKRSAETQQIHAHTAQSEAQSNLIKQQVATSKAQELDALAGVQLKTSGAALNSASEAAQRAQAYKTTEEGRFVAAQRAEVEAKQPLWNIFHSMSKKIKDVANSSSAENIKRAADNLRSIS